MFESIKIFIFSPFVSDARADSADAGTKLHSWFVFRFFWHANKLLGVSSIENCQLTLISSRSITLFCIGVTVVVLEPVLSGSVWLLDV